MSTPRPKSGRVLYLTGVESVELREEAVPAPGRGELLLAIEAATTCGTDLKVFLRGGHPRMLRVPSAFGHEGAGTVVETGAGVGEFVPGDALVVANSASCGDCRMCRERRENLCERLVYLNGTFADYLLIPEQFVRRSCHRRPTHVPAAIAALAEPLACVEHALERLAFPTARNVLLLGGGALGQLLVAALASEGNEVTLADPHAARRELATSLGAHRTVNAGRGLSAADARLERQFDMAIDVTGSVEGWSTAIAALRPGGTALFFGGLPQGANVAIPTAPTHYEELSLLGCYHHTPRSFARAIDRLAADPGRFAPMVTESRALDDVEGALRAMQTRQALKVAIIPRLSGTPLRI